MKIRLVDGSVYTATRAEVTNGRLEIDFKDKTSEQVQKIFSAPANISNIELLTDEDEVKYGDVPGWSAYGGVMLLGDTVTVILTKEIDPVQVRLTNAEARAMSAETRSSAAIKETNLMQERLKSAEAKVSSANSTAVGANSLAEEVAAQVTDLQMALCEIYEGIEAQQVLNQETENVG